MMLHSFTIFVLFLIAGTLSSNSDNDIDHLTAKQSEILQSIKASTSQCDSLGSRISDAIATIESRVENITDTCTKLKDDGFQAFYGELNNMLHAAEDIPSADREKCINEYSPIFFNVYNNIDNILNSCLEEKSKSLLVRLEELVTKVNEIKVKFKKHVIIVENCLVYAKKLDNPKHSEQCLEEAATKIKGYNDQLEQLSKNADQIISNQPNYEELERCLEYDTNGLSFDEKLENELWNSWNSIALCLDGSGSDSDDTDSDSD